MVLKYSRKFISQFKKYDDDKKLLQLIGKKINHVKTVSSASEISELVPIRKTNSHYRIKFKITEKIIYRIGISILDNTVWFACIEKDKKRFYKQFP